jgi:hypothetical protein
MAMELGKWHKGEVDALRTQLKDAEEVIRAAEEHGKGCSWSMRLRFTVRAYRAKYGGAK